jgi:putative transposase
VVPKALAALAGRPCIKFGTIYTRRLKRSHEGFGDTFYIDEVFAGVPDHSINGRQHYLWRAVDQESLPRFIGHEAIRVRERGMRRFKSAGQAQRFVTAHAAVQNLFNLGRHLVRAEHYRNLRVSAFAEWNSTVA